MASYMPHEFFTAHLKILFYYLDQKASINLFTRMIRNNSCSPIGMFKEHVATLLPLQFKAKLLKNF